MIRVLFQINAQYEKFFNQVPDQFDDAVKDNEKLYFLKEPDYKDLEEIEPKIVAKSIQIDYDDVKTTST